MVNLKRAERVGGRYVNAVPTGVGGFSTMLKALPLYLKNKEEKTPRKAPGPFRTDAAVYGSAPESGLRGAGLRVTWMGHSSMLVEVDGVRVLVDPVWDERASPVQWAGPKRFFEAPLRLEEMPRLDAVLISHDHYDHLGSTTVRRLAELPGMAATRWVTSAGVGEILRKFGVQAERITELNWTESTVLTGASGAEVKVTAVPARHFSGRGVTNRFETLWSSFVLRGPEHNVYFGADSGWWEGFAAIGAANTGSSPSCLTPATRSSTSGPTRGTTPASSPRVSAASSRSSRTPTCATASAPLCRRTSPSAPSASGMKMAIGISPSTSTTNT